jgi:predicted methyltransferase
VAAGFKLVGEGDFWHHPEDTHDFTTQPPTRPANEFVLKFQKPQ